MPVGTQVDIVSRIKTVLPNGWFQGDTPILDGVLNGIAWALAFVYSLASYTQLQSRISTATDGFLDLISADFFGSGLPRRSQENDSAFRTRILAELLLERGTRKGLIRVLQLLTGRTPKVFEPARPADTGGYNTNSCGYGVAGGYGSLAVPYQAFVIAYRPRGQGIPNIAGYNFPQGAYSTASQSEYANETLIQGAVTDADIYAAIDSVKVAGTLIWTQIQS
jgi:hypothetical protein